MADFPNFFKKSKRIDIAITPPQCSMVCVFCTAMVSDCHHSHRVLDDIAATQTTSACVYIVTRGRKEVDRLIESDLE